MNVLEFFVNPDVDILKVDIGAERISVMASNLLALGHSVEVAFGEGITNDAALPPLFAGHLATAPNKPAITVSATAESTAQINLQSDAEDEQAEYAERVLDAASEGTPDAKVLQFSRRASQLVTNSVVDAGLPGQTGIAA